MEIHPVTMYNMFSTTVLPNNRDEKVWTTGMLGTVYVGRLSTMYWLLCNQ